MSGSFGAFVSSFSLFFEGNPDAQLRINALARGTSSFLYGILNEGLHSKNGMVKTKNLAYYGVDALMDASYSTVYYYYNGISNKLINTAINGVADTGVDIFQTRMLPMP